MLQASVDRYHHGSSSLALDSGQASTHSSNLPSRKSPHRHFGSVLFERAEDMSTAWEPPAFIGDLNLDQIVDAVTAGLEEYRLQEFFHGPLSRVEAIGYRHEVFRDLENDELLRHVTSFAERMRSVRDRTAHVAKLRHANQRNAWFLDAVEFYCDAIRAFGTELSAAPLASRGLRAFRDYLSDYSASPRFTALAGELSVVKADLSTVSYCVLINGDKVTVRNYAAESDYSAEVEQVFEKFKQGAVKDYRVKFRSLSDMNHIEVQILDLVARLNPDTFSNLADYYMRHADFVDETVAAFDREILFYVAYLNYIVPLRRSGLQFCYPDIAADKKEIYSRDGFDMALAKKLVADGGTVVCNDFRLTGQERIIVVSGPNQGGKTTFARSFGQLHYFASLGCPVPGREARLFLFDKIFTHFERAERVESPRGKLEDDLLRARAILEQATSRSIVVMNEIFTSTTFRDEVFLSRKVIDELIARDLFCVWVTFVDELSRLGDKTVSIVSTIAPENPALRTFKLVRHPADGLAYAIAIAEKHRVTYDRIVERLGS
jgi:DNA mismatch repair protein MutS